MGLAKKVAYNTVVQVVGRMLGLAITLVTVNYIANHLIVGGSALKGYGQYTIIFTYVSVIGAAADVGLFTLLVREITGRSAKEAGELVGNALVFRLLLMGATLLLFLLLYQFLPYEPVVRTGIIVGVVVAFSMLFSQVIATVFQANLLADRIVLAETIGKVLTAAGTILVLKLNYGLIAVVIANLVGQLIIFLLSYLLVVRLVKIKLAFNPRLWRRILPQFGSIAVINILALVHFKSDSLLLTFFKPETDVGIYGAAYKLLEVVLVIPSIFATNLLPVITSALVEERAHDASRVIKRSSAILFLIAAYIIVLIISFAPQIIVFITQPDFLAAVAPLRILALAMIFIFLTTLLSQAIIASRDQTVLVRGYILVVILNVLLNLIIIPRYSYIGAATTTVITEAFLLFFTYRVSHRKFANFIHWPVLIRAVLAAGLTIGLIRVLPIGWFSLSAFIASAKLVQLVWLVGIGGLTALVFFLLLTLTFGGSLRQMLNLFTIEE